MRDVSKLHPKLREKVSALDRKCRECGIIIGIGECLRTVKEQDELYAKGRTKPGGRVTDAKGKTYSSMHQWGVAVDFYRNDGKGAYNDSDGFFESVGKIGESVGLEWGGRWKKIVDKPHFQLPDWGSTTSLLKKMYKTPENFMNTWENVEMSNDEMKRQTEELSQRIKMLEERCETVYSWVSQLPEYSDGTGKSTIEKLMNKGIYAGRNESDLNLPESLFRMLVILDRAGMWQ